MTRIGPRLVPALLLAAFVTSLPPSADAAEVVARSGEITLGEAAVRELIERSDAETRERLLSDPALLSQFVRARIARMAILAEAKAKKWDQSPEVAWRVEQARQDAIIDSYIASITEPPAGFPSETEIAAAYEANKSRFMVSRQYRLAQIYLAVPAGSAAAVEERTRKRAEELFQQASAPKADFAELARKHSEDKASAAKGGEFDWMPEDRLVPQVREVVAGLAAGSVGGPVRAADGWHVVKLMETRPASVSPLPEVRDDLVRALREQRAQEKWRTVLAELQKANPVQIDEIALSKLTKK